MTPQDVLKEAGWPDMKPEEEFAVLRAHGVSLQAITDLYMTMSEEDVCRVIENAIRNAGEQP